MQEITLLGLRSMGMGKIGLPAFAAMQEGVAA